MMKKLMPLLSVLVWTSSAMASDHHTISKKDCNKMKNGILYLLTVADQNWKALETNPEGTPDHLEHVEKIRWSIDLAANYTTIYEAFCDKK